MSHMFHMSCNMCSVCDTTTVVLVWMKEERVLKTFFGRCVLTLAFLLITFQSCCGLRYILLYLRQQSHLLSAARIL